MENKTITVTAEELRLAIGSIGLLLATEQEAVYDAMMAVPEFGAMVASSLQAAVKLAGNDKAKRANVLNAPVVVAFMIGVLVGRRQEGQHRLGAAHYLNELQKGQ